MILFRHEFRANLSADLPLARYEHDGVRNGTQLFHVTFSVSKPALLITSGHLHIRHAAVSIPTYGTNYHIYANGRVCLAMAAEQGLLPPVGSLIPEISLDGVNILSTDHKYSSPNLAAQKVLQPGHYRVECWASCGTDAYDVDGLGSLVAYNAVNCNQFNVRVEAL